MKRLLETNKYLILLIVLALCAAAIFTGHYGNILLDVGREVYYPQQILSGKVLYKDLFNIYGPFSYLVNALLFKVFGTKLSVLHTSGVLCAAGIVCGIYLTARKFLTEFLSFSLGLFTIAGGICAYHLFNFTFAYSQGMVWGLLAFVYSLLFLVKYVDTSCEPSREACEKNVKFLYLASFLSGAAVCCKYDFLLYSVVVFCVIFACRNLKIILKALGAFATIPLICFGVLFWQGLSVEDLRNFAAIMRLMSESQTLKYFYSTQGLYFRLSYIPYVLVFLTISATIFGAFVLAEKIKTKKILSYIVLVIASAAAFLVTNPLEFIYLPVLVLILGLIAHRKLFSNMPAAVLVVSALALCIKTFFGLSYQTYGNYYISTVLTAFFALMFLFVKKDYQKSAGIFLIITSLSIALSNFKSLPDFKITNKNSTIYTPPQEGQSTTLLIDYIEKNTQKSDKIVIYPEGLMINFLTNRKSDGWYNSMLPLYVEVFGEDKFIEHFQKSLPEYIIFNNKNMKDYYFEYICKDYAVGFCAFVNENYRQSAVISGELNYLIFKRKSQKLIQKED